MDAKLTKKHRLGISILLAGLVLLFTLPASRAEAAVPPGLEEAAQAAQRITGTVTSGEDGKPLIGVTVMVKGKNVGTVTDIDGKFVLEDVEEGDVLVFSYLGYVTQEVTVTAGMTTVDVVLMPDIAQLEEVVVVGYGQVKKSHLTGSVSKVKNELLDQIPVARVDEALVGRVSGVNIQMTNPSAGESPTIRVRGTGSITASSDPLIVVDGVPVDAEFLGNLDMNNVASVEVLKDAASAAIYGSRGANGVIMITTKGGEEGKPRFSYNTYVGFKEVPYNDKIFKTVDEWAAYVEQARGSLTDEMKYILQLGTETDWQKVMFDGGMIQSHNISASGGTNRSRYRLALGFLDDGGVLLTDHYTKYNVQLQLDTRVNDVVEMGIKLSPSYSRQRLFPIGVHDALRQSPWLPIYHDENTIQYVDRNKYPDVKIGDYPWERHFDNYDLYGNGSDVDISTTSNANAYAKVVERNRQVFRYKMYGSGYLKLNLAPGLSFRSSLGGDIGYRERRYWQGTKADRRGASRTSSFYSNSVTTHWVSENIFNYDLSKGPHDLNVVAGFAAEKWHWRNAEVEGGGFQFDFIETINAASVITGGSSNEEEASLLSYLARANYSYDNKYLVSISARTDGSSRFGPNNKFGFFPAFSVGWRVSEEDFLADNPVISDLKIRFSYGTTGNNSIGNYQHLGLLGVVGAVIDGQVVPGFNPLNIANPSLQWEKSVELNPGIDIGLYEGRIYLTAEVYKRTSDQLLLDQPVPSVTGFTEATVNIGEVENKGFELELTTHNINTGNFKWTSRVLFSRNKNTLTDFANADGLISIIDPKRPAEWINLVGHPISSFYGYVVDHEIDPQYIKDPYYPINAKSQDIYVKDLNGDGVITPDDRTILGSAYPDFVWSFDNQLQYKGFDLSFMFQGSHGAEVRNMDPQYLNNQFSSRQDYTSDFPDKDKVQQRIFTDDIIMDASYVALRTFNLGYSLPQTTLSSLGIQKLRLFVSANNLIYLMSDGYTGFNPEGINAGGDNPLTYGYQRGAAPIYRSVSFGLNLNF